VRKSHSHSFSHGNFRLWIWWKLTTADDSPLSGRPHLTDVNVILQVEREVRCGVSVLFDVFEMSGPLICSLVAFGGRSRADHQVTTVHTHETRGGFTPLFNDSPTEDSAAEWTRNLPSAATVSRCDG